MILIYLLVAYIFVVFVILRLIVPNLEFKQKPIPQAIPQELSAVIDKLNKEAENDKHYLDLAHKYVTSKYFGSHIRTVFNFWKAFQDPLTASPGFMHCMGQNHVLRAILIRSGRFKESDIVIKVTLLDFFIHQYLKVNVDGKFIVVDPWGKFIGTKIGNKSKWLRFSKN